jgi:hypothetical protein
LVGVADLYLGKKRTKWIKALFKIFRVVSDSKEIIGKLKSLLSTINVIFTLCSINLLIEKLANYRSHWGGHLAYVFISEKRCLFTFLLTFKIKIS